MKTLNSRQVVKFVSGFFFILFFLGALFWAKEQDPFSRKWFTLKTIDRKSFKCIAVLPKPIRRFPVVIYAHGWSGNLLKDGTEMQQMAELGLAAVSLEYDQTNEVAFSAQFEALLHYLSQQTWANTNAIAWVGLSMGANQMLDFALQHPQLQPQLLIQLAGAGIQEKQTNNRLEPLHSPVLLVHGEQDQTFPVADTERMASLLLSNGVPTEIKVLLGLPHGLEPDREVVFREVGEYCLMHLAGKDAWQNYHSVAQWETKAPRLWLFWLPAVAWAAGWFIGRSCKKIQLAKIPPKRSKIMLLWLAVVLATWALAETAIHLMMPCFSVNNTTLTIARMFLVQPKERADFEYLTAQQIWRGQQLKTPLEHAELAGYNRELINWHLDDNIYRNYVLSPIITGKPDEPLNWRRPLWEEFYPRIRHESLPEDAAKIVVRHLRERVTVTSLPNPPHDIPNIWLKQISDETGFEIIYVAALRSVDIAARLNDRSQAEIFENGKWQAAPRPVLENLLQS